MTICCQVVEIFDIGPFCHSHVIIVVVVVVVTIIYFEEMETTVLTSIRNWHYIHIAQV